MRVEGVKCASILIIILLFGLFISAIGLCQDSKTYADNLSQIYISAPEDVPEGGIFTARINITPGARFNAYQIQLFYDPNVIQITGNEGGTEGVSNGIVETTVIPIDMWSFSPAGTPGGAIRILGRIPLNQTVNGAGYLAEVHFVVIGLRGTQSSITPTGTPDFDNGLFDNAGKKLNTALPWSGSLVKVYQPLTITTSVLPQASIENYYNINLTASGGNLPYSWNGTGFPPGLNLTPNGNISGQPLQPGEYRVEINLRDASTPPAEIQKEYVLKVYPVFQITTLSLPEGTQGKNYSISLQTTEAPGPLTWSATGLPGGLNISASGVISGSPLVSGQYNINITVTDSFNPPHSITRTLPVNLYAALTVSTEALNAGQVGNTYNAVITASGGKAPYAWSAVGLPAGINLNSSGSLTGIPSAAGDYNITVFVNDSFNPFNTASRAFTLHINDRLQIITSSLPEGMAGKSFSINLAASGGMPPYSWSASGLPSGLTCSSNGNISGIPATAGNYAVNVVLRDSFNPVNTLNQDYNFQVFDNLIITATKIPDGVIGKTYHEMLTATGSRSPYSWTVNGLPSGLAAEIGGNISGTPQESGDFVLNVTVTGSLNIPYSTSGTVNLKIYKLGDADGNGSVNMGDATYVMRVVLGLANETPGCDANLNGSISIGDVTLIERIILGLN